MSRRAKMRGAVGTVVRGRVRDLEEHRALGFPVGESLPAATRLTKEMQGDEAQLVLTFAGLRERNRHSIPVRCCESW